MQGLKCPLKDECPVLCSSKETVTGFREVKYDVIRVLDER